MLSKTLLLLVLSMLYHQRKAFVQSAASDFAPSATRPKLRVNVLYLSSASDTPFFQAKTFAQHLRYVKNRNTANTTSSYGSAYPDSWPWPGNSVLGNVEVYVTPRDTKLIVPKSHNTGEHQNSTTDVKTTTNTVSEPVFHLIVGPKYSNEAKAVSQVTSFYNLVLISGAAWSPTLSDRSRYPNFFRTCPSGGDGPDVIANVLTYFGYNQLSALYQDEEYVMDFREIFEPIMRARNIKVENSFVYAPHDNRAYLHLASTLGFRAKSHVWLTLVIKSQYELFCAMFKYGKIGGATFLGLMFGQVVDSQWLDSSPSVTVNVVEGLNVHLNDCTIEQLRSVADGALQIVPNTASYDDSVDVLGLRPSEFRSDMEAAMEINNRNKNRTKGYFDGFSSFLYFWFDAVTAAALTLDRVEYNLRRNHNKSLAYFHYNDSEVVKVIIEELGKLSFQGLSGSVGFSTTGDRVNNTWMIRQFQGSKFVVVGRYQSLNATSYNITLYGNLKFPTEDNKPPPQFAVIESWATPANITLIALGTAALLLGALCLSFFVYRWLKESELQALLGDADHWLIKQDALTMDTAQSSKSSSFFNSNSTLTMPMKPSTSRKASIETTVSEICREKRQNLLFLPCKYEGLRVCLFMLSEVDKNSTKTAVIIDRKFAAHLQRIRTCSHDNLSRFVGVVKMFINEANTLHVIMAASPKGTLSNFVADSKEDVQLDETCSFLFLKDLQSGLSEVHKLLDCHGRLSSTICMVDARLSLRISDYGFGSYRQEKFFSPGTDYRHWLWSAPEVLRHVLRTNRTQERQPEEIASNVNNVKLDWIKCDMYSFGIIMAEVFCQSSPPFQTEAKSVVEVRHLLQSIVQDPVTATNLWQAEMKTRTLAQDITDLALACMSGNILQRPTLNDIGASLRIMMKSRKLSDNLTEMLMLRLETYATDLASLVEQRTAALVEEENKVRRLLYQILPPSVADALKNGQSVPPKTYDSVTVYFSDVVGFTAISAQSTPLEVVDLLNDLYNMFDVIVGKCDVYKVETIGDAYMVVSGLPTPNGIEHARCIVRMALLLIDHVVNVFKIRHRPGEQLLLRVGVHSGPCAAGVVGFAMPRYCLFGDTVNTASRMESTGEALRIHASEATTQILRDMDKNLAEDKSEFCLQLRGEMEIKGKGIMRTFWISKAAPG